MRDSWVTVGSFSTLVEAEMARNRLESEGIESHLSDGEAVTMVWAFASAMGGVKLLVAEEDAGRAKFLLARIKNKPSANQDDYGLEENVTDVPQKVRVPMQGEPEPTDPDDDEEEAKDSPKDVIARRAFRAAVFGLITCPGVLHLISVFILMELGDKPGELTSAGRTWLLLAVVIDMLVFISIVAFVVAGFRH